MDGFSSVAPLFVPPPSLRIFPSPQVTSSPATPSADPTPPSLHLVQSLGCILDTSPCMAPGHLTVAGPRYHSPAVDPHQLPQPDTRELGLSLLPFFFHQIHQFFLPKWPHLFPPVYPLPLSSSGFHSCSAHGSQRDLWEIHI